MRSNLDILNNLYHSNARQIDQLVRANAEVSRAIVNIINREQHASRARQYTTRQPEQNSVYDNDVRDALLTLMDENVTQPLQQTTRRANSYTIPITNQSTIDRILNTFLAPVDIFPTQTQIETATRVVRYGDIARPHNTSCPISLDAFGENQLVTVIRHCGHIFNTEQIGAWFRANCRCPVCRYDIRNYRTSIDVNTEIEEQ
jgi:hypothetical protein